MTLTEKILSLYPTVTDNDLFYTTIDLMDITGSPYTIPDDAVSVGSCYIKRWEHPTLTKPTQAQLDAIGE